MGDHVPEQIKVMEPVKTDQDYVADTGTRAIVICNRRRRWGGRGWTAGENQAGGREAEGSRSQKYFA
jgi:hypothetical protein